jgi:sporulation protein YlmC with PRC-barrel domain
MKPFQPLVCASVLVCLPAALRAQEPAPQEKPTTTTIQIKKIKLMRVGSDIVGTDLVTPKNEPLGKAEDLVIHPKGDVAFVEFSGAAAVRAGEYRYVAPWRALDHNENGQFVLAVTPENFPKMPRYEKADLTAIPWWVDADKAYAKIMASKSSPVEASASLAPAKVLYLASDLRARSVENPDGEKVATMHELVIDPSVGRVAYAVLTVGGTAGAGEKMIAVPWEALKSMPDKANPKIERLTLATTKENLEQAPEFQATTEGWTKASEPDYVLKVYEFYSLPPYKITVPEKTTEQKQ